MIANSLWGGSEIDLVCLLPAAILIVDFKHYQGQLNANENGPWLIDGIEVKGGSKANPFQQLRNYKFSIIEWLEKNNLLQGRDLGHINAAVVFSGPVTGSPQLSVKASYWFHSTDLQHCAAVLADLASPSLNIYSSDMTALIRQLGVQEIATDYGQNNIKLAPAKAEPANQQKVTKVSQPPLSSPVATAADFTPVAKRPLSGMFKTAAVVGGLFLTLAVVSQIYPTIGQSNTVITEPAPPTVLSSAQQQPAYPEPNSTNVQLTATTYAPTAVSNADNTMVQIPSQAAVNYIGQEVTVCGPVSQTTGFSKGTYLNFDKPYPQHSMTLVLWDEVRTVIESKLGALNELTGIEVCATGQMEQYKQKPQMQIKNATAIRLQSLLPQQGVSSSQQTKSVTAKENSNVERIEAYRAPFYVGKQVMACGVLAGTSQFSKGLYLSLDKKYPNQTLTLVLWDENVAPIEAKFGSLNRQIGQTFCALGTIEKYKQSLQIQIENPQFLRLMQ